MGPAIKRQEHYPIKTAAAAPPTGRSESSWRTEPLVGRCAEAGEKLSDDPENYGLFLFADPDQTRSSPIRFFAQHFLEPQYYYSTKSLVDCDVLTYVYEGSLELSGRSGKIASIEEGGVLRISQGPDAVHALDNSDARLACFMRIVIAADAAGIDATYEIKTFSETEKRGRWRLIASRGGRDGSIALRADVNVYASLLDAGETAHHALIPNRVAWAHATFGALKINGQTIHPGVALKLSGIASIDVVAESEQAEVLLFDSAA